MSYINKRDNIPVLTGLRFLAALSVMMCHCSISVMKFEPYTPWVNIFHALAGFGMPLFFVLSGFVIHYNYQIMLRVPKVGNTIRFLIIRLARLYPLYAVVLIAEFFYNLGSRYHTLWPFTKTILINESSLLQITLPLYSTFTQSWLYKLIPNSPHSVIYAHDVCSQVSWSISTEWGFYLMFPLFCWLICKLRTKTSVILFSAIIYALLMSATLYIVLHSQQIDVWATSKFGQYASIDKGWQSSYLRWLIYFNPITQCANFIIGTCLAQAYILLKDKPVSYLEDLISKLSLAIAIISFGLLYYFAFINQVSYNIHLLSHNCLFTLPIAAIIFLYARYQLPLTNLLKSRFFIWAGEASLSIYLLHMFIGHNMILRIISFDAVPFTIPTFSFRFLCLVAICAVIILASRLTYVFIEVKGQRVMRTALLSMLDWSTDKLNNVYARIIPSKA